MHFINLTQIGDDYAVEEGGEGVRRAALNAVAAQLAQKRYDLEAARQRVRDRTAMVVNPAVTSVRDRINFFSGGAGQQQQGQAEAEVKKLEDVVAKLQAKLTRQGAVLRPDGSIDWGVTARTVVYDHTAAAQGLTRLRFANRLLYTDDACKVAFDTSNMVTHFGGRGWAIYVMSPTGNIHVSSHSVGNRHHSSLLAGGDVAGAGEIKVLGGKLVHISNKSGHYAPGAAHLLQVLYVLQKRGVDLNQTKVTFKTASDAADYPNVAAFLADLPNKGVDPDFEFSKMMAYLNRIPYPQFQNLAAAKGWRWGTPADFALGGPAQGGRGVVTNAGLQVPHKEVRKWLKGLGHTMKVDTQSGYLR